MAKYWVPTSVENPNLRDDIKKFHRLADSDDKVDRLLNSSCKEELETILSRLEFIDQLLFARKILDSRKQIKSTYKTIQLYGQAYFVQTNLETIDIEGYNFAGATYDIEALCQYLLIGCIENLSTPIKKPSFTDWLKIKSPLKTEIVIKDELAKLEEEYQQDTSISSQFRKTFLDLSAPLKNRIVSTFLIVDKVEPQKIDEINISKWENRTEEEKIRKIATYLYSSIRCQYTHRASRTFLSEVPIEKSLGMNFDVLVLKVDPTSDNLISILKDVISELLVKNFPC